MNSMIPIPYKSLLKRSGFTRISYGHAVRYGCMSFNKLSESFLMIKHRLWGNYSEITIVPPP